MIVFVCFPFLSCAGGGLSDDCAIVGVISFLELRVFHCKAGFVDTHFLNLFLLWNILFSPPKVKESFAGYSSLSLYPWSLSVCIMLEQDLLAFIVFTEKSGVNQVGLPSYVT